MNSSALVTMVITQVLVTFFMVYFFVKVLRAPKQVEPDSYSDNDEE
jgi:heme/copper-type cytochrome/quinol oxidase subunit 2